MTNLTQLARTVADNGEATDVAWIILSSFIIFTMQSGFGLLESEAEKVEMSLQDFKIMSVEALRVFLSLRKKDVEGDFDTLVYRAIAAWEEGTPVDISAEQQHITSQNEYKKKLIIDNTTLLDPLTLKQSEWLGETEQGMQQWPQIYYNDISKFLVGINTPSELLHRLDCEYKEGKRFRYYACDFVKEIFYYKISDLSPLCFLKCKVTPSQRTSSTAYNVWAVVHKNNPGGKIHSAYCSCTTGLLGSCNHVTAMLFRGNCKCCGDSIVEIKCPYSICESKPTVENFPCLEEVLIERNSIVQLKRSHSYYTQIQGQLAITKAKFAWFFVYTHNGNHLEKICISDDHWNKVEANLIYFWNKYLAPSLINRNITINKDKHTYIIKQLVDTPTCSTQAQAKINKNISINTPSSSKQTEKVLEKRRFTLNFVSPPLQKKRRLKKPNKASISKIYLCNVCQEDCVSEPETFNENSICCTKCQRWYHFLCVKIKSKNDIPNQKARWLCTFCK